MCDCRKLMNEKLAPLNARLAFGFTFGGGHMDLSPPMISTERLKPRGKTPPAVLATFCPFCGEKYDKMRCERCSGDGYISGEYPDMPDTKCPECNGIGRAAISSGERTNG